MSAVAAVNPNTIVVLETGGPVSMPWRDQVKGILEAWYPGIGGAQAIANILFGDVDPSGKLPVTFAKSDSQLAFPEVPGIDLKPVDVQVPTVMRGQRIMHNEKRLPPFDVDYNVQGARVGYKWFESKNIQPLFPFGFGLSYTSYEYSGLKVDESGHEVSFDVKNTGNRAGTEIAEVYAALPAAAGEIVQAARSLRSSGARSGRVEDGNAEDRSEVCLGLRRAEGRVAVAAGRLQGARRAVIGGDAADRWLFN